MKKNLLTTTAIVTILTLSSPAHAFSLGDAFDGFRDAVHQTWSAFTRSWTGTTPGFGATYNNLPRTAYYKAIPSTCVGACRTKIVNARRTMNSYGSAGNYNESRDSGLDGNQNPDHSLGQD